MRLVRKFAASALLLTAFTPGSLANPMEASSKGLTDRASPLQLGTCVLSQNQDLGNCNLREWVLCTAIAAGACFIPCEAGGFVDPLCDACVTAMGTAGCLECVKSSPSSVQLYTVTMQSIHNKRRTMLNLLRSQFYVQGQNLTLKVDLDDD